MSLRRLQRGLVALAALALCLAPAWAREVTDAERALLEETVTKFDAAMWAKDLEGMTAALPPKYLEAIAGGAGMTLEDLKKVMLEQMSEAMAAITLVSATMDTANTKYAEMSDEAGTPYALIPTETVMDAGTGKIRQTGETLAVIEEGAWYLLRVDENQVALLKNVYPGLADVQFNYGTMETVEE